VSDHYLYLGMIGPALALAWLIGRFDLPAMRIGAGGVLVIFAAISFTHAAIWRNDFQLGIALLERALSDARRLGLSGCETDASVMLALAYALRGELRRAERLAHGIVARVERSRGRSASLVPASKAFMMPFLRSPAV